MKQSKINIKVIAIVIYFILFVSVLIYQHYATARVVEKADRAIQRQKEYSQTVTAPAAVAPEQNMQINAAVVQEDYKESVPSTDLFLKAVESEKGEQQQGQPQILDYGAQVAAYEAQAKAQQQKAAQQPQSPQAYTAPLPPQRQTGAVVNRNPAPLTQQEKEQGTKLNKLETRRIFK